MNSYTNRDYSHLTLSLTPHAHHLFTALNPQRKQTTAMARNTKPNRKTKTTPKALARSPDKDDAKPDDQLRLQPGKITSPPFPLLTAPTPTKKPSGLTAIGSPTSNRSNRHTIQLSVFTPT